MKVGGFESFVFEFSDGSESYILRFVHSSHRVYEQVLAELEFIEYLDSNNSPVSTVIHSINNKTVEKIEIDDIRYLSVCVFEKAHEVLVTETDQTDEFFIMFGEKLENFTISQNPLIQ